jgi:hypothetical protein
LVKKHSSASTKGAKRVELQKISDDLDRRYAALMAEIGLNAKRIIDDSIFRRAFVVDLIERGNPIFEQQDFIRRGLQILDELPKTGRRQGRDNKRDVKYLAFAQKCVVEAGANIELGRGKFLDGAEKTLNITRATAAKRWPSLRKRILTERR